MVPRRLCPFCRYSRTWPPSRSPLERGPVNFIIKFRVDIPLMCDFAYVAARIDNAALRVGSQTVSRHVIQRRDAREIWPRNGYSRKATIKDTIVDALVGAIPCLDLFWQLEG